MPMNDAQTWRSRHAHIRRRTRLAGYGGRRWLALGALGMLVCVSLASFSTWAVWADAPVGAVQENEGDPPPKAAQFETKNLHGTIVWTAEVLESEFGISTAPETARNTLSLRTRQGQLLPIAENVRGRAFRADPRLRERELEISGRVFRDHPFLVVVALYEWVAGQRFELDYWCDVCAIPMYELGPCDCCQEENRLRRRRVVDGQTLPEER